jgi:hypothetical protein
MSTIEPPPSDKDIDIKEVGIDKSFVNKIKDVLDKVLILIQEVTYNQVDPTLSGKWTRLTRSFNRNIYASHYTKELLRQMTILNSYFVIYESKVSHIVRRYEHYLNYEIKKKEEPVVPTNKTKEIWDEIYVRNTYTDLILKEEPPTNGEVDKDEYKINQILSGTDKFLTFSSILLVSAEALGAGAVASGVGIPLAGVLFALAAGVKMIRNKKELLYVIFECTNILNMCFKIHCANMTQLICFQNVIYEKPVFEEHDSPKNDGEKVKAMINNHVTHVKNTKANRIMSMFNSMFAKQSNTGGKRTKKKNKKHRTKRSKYMRQKTKRRHTAKRRASKK